MNELEKAAKQALEALEGFIPYLPIEHDKQQCDRYDKAITALRQALANEALDRMAENARDLGLDYEPVIDESAAKRIATALGWKPAAQWVGLTDEEIQDSVRLGTISHNRHRYSIRSQQITPADDPLWHIARAIEQALKEKNI